LVTGIVFWMDKEQKEALTTRTAKYVGNISPLVAPRKFMCDLFHLIVMLLGVVMAATFNHTMVLFPLNPEQMPREIAH
jgi:hypothetical protein